MKKIIFVSGIQIFPPESGGQLRSANLCLALAKQGHDVEIYSFTGRKKDYLAHKKSSSTQIATNLNEYVNRNPLWGFLQFLFYKLQLPPFWLTWLTRIYCPRILKNKLKNCSSLVLDFPFLYPIGIDKNYALIINTHNAEFELYSKSKFLPTLVKNIELAAFKKGDNVLFCNDSDVLKFTDNLPQLSQKALILPNGIHLDHFVFDESNRKKIRKELNLSDADTVLLFTGSRYLPNLHAFDYLIKWAHENSNQLVAEKIVILVAGTVSETRVDLPYLKVVGKVPEMIPYFWASDFGLNAIEEGSGTNVKMIEYLAARLPIVTTVFGARGIRLVDQQTCFYFDKDNLFSVIKKAKQMNESQKNSMAQEAFLANQDKIDMGHALKNLIIKW